MTSEQGQRKLDGDKLEKLVYFDINNSLSKDLLDHNLSLHLGSTLKKLRPDIFKKLAFYPANSNKPFIGDVDIVIYDEKSNRPVMIISTKTSSRERLYQVACTKFMYREKYPDIYVWFVTNEAKGAKHSKGIWESEYGTEERPRQPRQLGNYFGIPIFSSHPNTNFGGCVKPYSKIISEISKVLL